MEMIRSQLSGWMCMWLVYVHDWSTHSDSAVICLHGLFVAGGGGSIRVGMWVVMATDV